MKKPFQASLRAGRIQIIITLIFLAIIYVFFTRTSDLLKQIKSEMTAIIDPSESLCLDGLQRLGSGKADNQLEKYMTGFSIQSKDMDSLRNSFYSPYIIRETSSDYESPPARTGSDSFRAICAAIPDLEKFPDQLLSHLASPGILFAGNPPASSSVVFSSITPSFSSYLDEAILWYTAGRLLAEQGRGSEAFRVFTGIISLAIAFENDRLTHPDKDRRQKSCIIREIAATGLIESSAKLFSTRADLISAIAEIKRLDKSFIPIDQILAYDKKIPIEFGRQLASDVAAGLAIKKYGKEMTCLAGAFSDQTELSSDLDLLYDPLVTAFSQPYFIAQREYNPWQAKHDSYSSEISLFYADKTTRHLILQEFTGILPFYTLIDIKTRQLMQGACAAMIVNVYNTENGSWPTSLAETEKWLGQPMPRDIIRNISLQFKPGNPPYLASVGRDGKANTSDDLIFMPFGKKAEE